MWKSFHFRFFADMMICSGCCGTLDNIVSYIFKQILLKCKFGNCSAEVSLNFKICSRFSIFNIPKQKTSSRRFAREQHVLESYRIASRNFAKNFIDAAKRGYV